MAAKEHDPTEVGTAPLADSRELIVPELVWAAVLHLWNDGLPVALTVLLPSITADLRLTYMQAALLRTLDTGVAGATQIPLAALASRGLEVPLLGGGLVWFGVFTAGLGLTMTFVTALACAMVGGIARAPWGAWLARSTPPVMSASFCSLLPQASSRQRSAGGSASR